MTHSSVFLVLPLDIRQLFSVVYFIGNLSGSIVCSLDPNNISQCKYQICIHKFVYIKPFQVRFRLNFLLNQRPSLYIYWHHFTFGTPLFYFVIGWIKAQLTRLENLLKYDTLLCTIIKIETKLKTLEKIYSNVD